MTKSVFDAMIEARIDNLTDEERALIVAVAAEAAVTEFTSAEQIEAWFIERLGDDKQLGYLVGISMPPEKLDAMLEIAGRNNT